VAHNLDFSSSTVLVPGESPLPNDKTKRKLPESPVFADMTRFGDSNEIACLGEMCIFYLKTANYLIVLTDFICMSKSNNRNCLTHNFSSSFSEGELRL
jgi:hypothetical protein